MVLFQEPPENYIKVDIGDSFDLQKKGFHPMYVWNGYHYYRPSTELNKYIKNGGE